VNVASTLYGIAVTMGMYALSRRLSQRWPSPFTSPVFFTTAATILVFLLTRVQYSDYAWAQRILTILLGPATVALAIPLYKNRRLLVENLVPAITGLCAGALGTMITAVALAKALGLSRTILVSISIKSVTAPVAVEIARVIHGDPTLTAAFVIVTGMLGVMLGPWLLDRAGIRSPLARGLALGTISHGQGTAQAALEGELAGAIASIALGVAAVFTSFVAPVLLLYL
jgi:predicted murein hydrolase (TIGR00659 family)